MTDEPSDPLGAAAVAVDDEQDVPVDADHLVRTAERVFAALGVPAGAALFVSLVGPARIAELKERALGVRRPTDVLSFPMDDPGDPSPGPLVLGDVVICPAVARSQARALGRSFGDEMAQLLVHGILHLTGWDHPDAASELAMARRERALLAEVA